MPHQFIGQDDKDLAGGLVPSRLRQALENDELALFCQPIMALGDEPAYRMAEVLIRLREEEEAMLPPGEFLPVFEHYGMMAALDRWVVRRVVHHLAQDASIHCYTINLATQTIEDEEFPDFLADRTSALAPGSIVLEVDESDLIARPLAVKRLVAAAKSASVGIAIDGFGRESVSFALVEALAPTHVKVDGSIIRKLSTSEVARTKVAAVVRVSRTVPFDVIAECVEDDEVMKQAEALGVHYAQGLGIHKPQPLAMDVEVDRKGSVPP